MGFPEAGGVWPVPGARAFAETWVGAAVWCLLAKLLGLN